jgi:hypothetical protein
MPLPLVLAAPLVGAAAAGGVWIGSRIREAVEDYLTPPQYETTVDILIQPDIGYITDDGEFLVGTPSAPKYDPTNPFKDSTFKVRKVKVISQARAQARKIEGYAYMAIAATAAIVTGGAAFAAGISFIAGLGTVGALVAGSVLGGLAVGTFTALNSVIVSTVSFALNFNLNISDEELDKQIQQRLNSFYGLLGGVVGKATGYLVCGALPGTLAFAFNPGMASAAMAELDEEAREEIYQSIALISASAIQTLINAELSNRFKSARRFLKANPDNPFSKFMKRILGEENFNRWGESNRPAFTIQQDVIEKRVEAIPDQRQRQFLEQFLEEFADSCIEAGFIVANNFDSYLAAQSLMQRQVLGKQTDVIITIDD